jgi:hypothetical protein
MSAMRGVVATGVVLGMLIVATSTAAASDGHDPVGAAKHETCVPRGSHGRGHTTTRARARRVIERYARETMQRCDGVEGMGVGAQTPENRPPRDEERVHHIAIYLRDPASKPPHARSIAGVRIVYVVTGTFGPA